MLSFHIGILADRLSERNLRLAKFHIYFISLFQHADNNVKMLITHTINKALAVSAIIHNSNGAIFTHDLGKSLGYLILIPFVHCLKSLIGIRNRKNSFWIKDRIGLCSKTVACLYAYKLGDGANISCMKFRNLDGLGALKHIQLIQTFLNTLLYVKKCVICLNYTRAYLDQGIFAKERIYNRLPYIGRFSLSKVIISLKDLIGLLCNTIAGSFIRAWEISADIIQQVGNTPQIHRGTHAHRHNTCFLDIGSKCCRNLCNRELIAFKITIHKFFACFSYRLHQDIMVFFKVLFQVIRNRAFFFHAFVNIFSAGLFHNIYIAYKLTILTDREMKRCDLLAI